jgi:Flp pilus assembly protein TadG
VTAEFAAVVPAVILVLACCLGGLQLSTQQLRVQSAAAVSARSVARGESVPVSGLLSGATATTQWRGNLVCVRVSAPGRGLAGLFGAVKLTASGCALASGG